MKLIRYRNDPFKTLGSLQDEINKLFDFPGANLASLDLSEDEKNIYVETDIPGFDQKDINVKIKGDSLLISARRDEKKEEKKKNYYRCKRCRGSFYREIGLPSRVDEAKISAKYKNGVLDVTLPKKETEKEKEVKIDAG